ncbi:MAG: hypothetical protein ACRCTX_10465 [Afipia sp.]
MRTSALLSHSWYVLGRTFGLRLTVLSGASVAATMLATHDLL